MSLIIDVISTNEGNELKIKQQWHVNNERQSYGFGRITWKHRKVAKNAKGGKLTPQGSSFWKVKCFTNYYKSHFSDQFFRLNIDSSPIQLIWFLKLLEITKFPLYIILLEQVDNFINMYNLHTYSNQSFIGLCLIFFGYEYPPNDCKILLCT